MRARLLSAFPAVRFTRRGWWFLGSAFVGFIGAYAGGRQELLYVACLLVTLPAVAFLVVWMRRPTIDVLRTFAPELIQAGETTTVKLMIRNTARSLTMAARWRDGLPWYPFATPEGALPRLQPRGARFAGRGNSVTVGYNLRPPHRGVFTIGPMTVETTDAFGLARLVARAGDSAGVTVTPQVVALSDSGLSVASGDGDSRLMQRRATGNDDDITTREYRSGDAMRRVHWRASARHGDLMVRQEEQRSFPEARIIVDTVRSSYRDAAGGGDEVAESAAFEWVVRMLASVAVHLRRSGFLVTIDETGPSQLVSLGRLRTWGDEQLLTSLASISLTTTVRRTKPRRAGSGGPVIALIARPDGATLEWLLAQRRPGELAVAFMVRGLTALDELDRHRPMSQPSAIALAQLHDSGWLVVSVKADEDHALAWDAVTVDMGRSRGNA